MVRDARTEDISRIAEILVFGKRVAYRPIFRDDEGSFNDLQVLDVARAYQTDALPLAETLVYDDGIVRGMLRGRFVAPDEAELCELYVDPFFTGMGIGRALADYFLREAARRGARRVRLWVIADNARARKFYSARGFAPDGQSRLIEGTAVTEVRYARELQGCS